MRAPASACAFDSVRRIASVEKRAEPGGEARAARPFDVGLVDHDDGLAVERRAHRLQRVELRASCRSDCWASTDTRSSRSGCQAPSSLLRIETPAARALERDLEHARALDVRRHLVHAEGRRALQDRIRAGAQIDPRQQIDGLVAPARRRAAARPALRTGRPGARSARAGCGSG